MIDSKKCSYWQHELDKLNFTQTIREQLLDGENFELVDGRNLEMKGDIIRQIIGNNIECTKCIVVCVIGPQSTGKSTLMNFCFGTQFLASTGRCTQGIYFTLQRIPQELKEGKDVEYLIILDTEGLNSPERAEPEYDRKIVMFTLLCSDFLIINSRGDLNYQMKELIKICTVRYDQLRGSAKVPKILYTFVQNNDTNPANFIAQISSLKSDVIECSTTCTIKKTADELMTVHENLVKVMGSAYIQQPIEKDENKGLFEINYINRCSPLFGVQSSQVWLEVQKLFLQKDYKFRQIGTWLSEAQDHWNLIERHGAQLIKHENVFALKNDTKMQEYFNKLWNEYLNTKITAKDNIKAQKNSQSIFDLFLDGNDLNKEKSKFIKANDEEKSIHFDKMWYQFEKWKSEQIKNNITQDLETKHNQELKKKMDVLKDSFELLLENNLKEIQMIQIHKNGISDLFRKARDLILTVQKIATLNEKEKLINQEFEKAWDQIIKELSGLEQIDKLRLTNWEYLSQTFKSVNSFMSIIKPYEYSRIIAAADSEDFYENQGLPKQLVTYLVDHISKDAFINDKGQLDYKNQFKLDFKMLELLKDPSQRIFIEKEKDKYLPLQTLFKVNYDYEILDDIVNSYNTSSFYDLIQQSLSQKKNIQVVQEEKKWWDNQFESRKIIQEDDQEQIIQIISSLFQDFGQAGFGLEQKVNTDSKNDFQNQESTNFLLLSNLNVKQEFEKLKIFNNTQRKEMWLKDLKKRITWKKSENIIITPKVQQTLRFSLIHFSNQIHPKIKFDEHIAQSKEIQDAIWCNRKPILSYVFSTDQTGGKRNFQKLLQDRNQLWQQEQFLQCLIDPVKCEFAESQKWTYLSQLASMLLDWNKIVLTINEKVSKEINKSNSDLQSQNKKNQINDEFDLRNALELNQITLQQAESINKNQLQGIKQELDHELHSKLALLVHPTLSGVITWVACVIIWYKSQYKILTKFNEQLKKLESHKQEYRKNFRDIALGVTATVTIEGARQIFNDTFKIFNDDSKGLILKQIDEFFQSKDILDRFDTDQVYDEMDRANISSANAEDYKKCIEYVLNPVDAFELYVGSLKSVLIEKLESVQMNLYKERVNSNLNALRKRLEHVYSIIQRNKQWNQSVNLFEILKYGETVPLLYQDKKKIESQLSPIYLNTLKQILEGNFKIGSSEVTLKENEVLTKFLFTTKGKDKNEIGSPLQDLQNLQFQYDNNICFIQIVLLRLGLNDKNFGLCSDLRVMIENLILLIDSKILEIESLTLIDICDINQQIKNLQNNAVGCRILCQFCNRKCEHKPHNDNKDGGIPHSCEKRGHQLRVFGGGCFFTYRGQKCPSLFTCDKIHPNTHIKITTHKGTETRIWSEIHKEMNRNWATNHTKFNVDALNPVQTQMHLKLQDLWKVLGTRYCQDNQYKYILPDDKQFSKDGIQTMNEKSIVILCLDNSASMFNSKNDFDQAIAGCKQIEKNLKDNHKNQSQVHLQLWYNDCHGVTQAYKGQLNDAIPSQAWVRSGCQTDKEILGLRTTNYNYGSCGQFTGALRILNIEVNLLLDYDSGYKNVYWFMFSDGGSNYPNDELEQLRRTFKSNPQKWTDPTGSRSKLIPLIITNQPEAKSLIDINNRLNQISKEVWGEENFCYLNQNLKLDQLGAMMVERFTFK